MRSDGRNKPLSDNIEKSDGHQQRYEDGEKCGFPFFCIIARIMESEVCLRLTQGQELGQNQDGDFQYSQNAVFGNRQTGDVQRQQDNPDAFCGNIPQAVNGRMLYRMFDVI